MSENAIALRAVIASVFALAALHFFGLVGAAIALVVIYAAPFIWRALTVRR